MNKHSPRAEVKGLWWVFWRMVVLMQVAVLGAALFSLLIALDCGFLWAIGAALRGHCLLAIVLFALWVVWLRWGKPVRRFCLEGFEGGTL